MRSYQVLSSQIKSIYFQIITEDIVVILKRKVNTRKGNEIQFTACIFL